MSRWKKLDRCLQSIRSGSLDIDEILVLDNSEDPGSNPILSKHDVTVIPVEDQIGPSEARMRLAEAASEQYVMFIDADVRAKPNSIKRLYNRLKHTENRAASGIWTDFNQYYRRIGNNIIIDKIGGKVLKQPIPYRDVKSFDTVEIEFGTPQIMIENRLFEQVQFDPEYDFFYEWWDFFMQLKHINEGIVSDLEAEFIHEPGGYEGDESTRHDDYDPESDKQYFENKWGYEPITTALDDGSYNPSLVNRYLSYSLEFINMAQKRKL